MPTITVSQLDADGYYQGPTPAQADPLDPGTWLLPAGAVAAPPPDLPAGTRARWDADAGAWEIDAATPATIAELRGALVAVTQAHLDAFAATRGYDHILSACTYAGSAVPQFALEGAACVALRDATWAALYAIEAEVTAGTRPAPACLADLLPDLPALVWPDAA